MLGISLALLCGVSWAIASFTSGRASRVMSAPLLVASYNLAGSVLFGTMFLLSNETEAISDSSILSRAIFTGVIGGIGFSAGLVFLARGMSRGRASIISPLIAVVSIIAPAIYTAFTGDLPDSMALVGIATLLTVPWLAARTHRTVALHVTRSVRRDSLFGVAAGAGFGFYFIGLIAAPEEAQLFMLMVIQLSSLIVMAISHILSKASWRIPKSAKTFFIVFLIFELLGVIFLRLALNNGSGASIAAVSGTVDPLGILILSRFFNRELFTKYQLAGFAIMAVGITLVSLNA